MAGWGSGAWGGRGWGSPSGPSNPFSVSPIRENVIRITFPEVPYYSGLLDPGDASDSRHYTVSPVDGTIGRDGDPARPVSPIAVMPGDSSFSVDVVLDRTMSPYPARYLVGFDGVVADVSKALLDEASQVEIDGMSQAASPILLDGPPVSRDIANPQVPRDAQGDAPLGTIPVGGDGDYASTSGVPSLRQRVIRRLTSLTNGFAHLPGYGLGITAHAKRNITPSWLTLIESDGQRQVEQEPEVEKAIVSVSRNADTPGLVRFVVAVRMHGGGVDKWAFDA